MASEPVTYKNHGWILIEKNHAVVVSGDTDVTVEKLSYVGDSGEKV